MLPAGAGFFVGPPDTCTGMKKKAKPHTMSRGNLDEFLQPMTSAEVAWLLAACETRLRDELGAIETVRAKLDPGLVPSEPAVRATLDAGLAAFGSADTPAAATEMILKLGPQIARWVTEVRPEWLKVQ